MDDWKSTALRIAAWTLDKLAWLLRALGTRAESSGRYLAGVALRLDPDLNI